MRLVFIFIVLCVPLLAFSQKGKKKKVKKSPYAVFFEEGEQQLSAGDAHVCSITKDGLFIRRNINTQNGKMSSLIMYSDSTFQVKEGEAYYLGDTGSIIEKGSFKNNLKHGKWENFSSNGNLVKEGFYANGVIAGPWKTFNKDNGQVTFSYFFQGGKLNGPFQVFDDEGTLQTEGAFKNNEVETNSNPEVNIPWPTEIITMAQFPGCNDDLPKEAAIECGHEKLLAYLAEHIEYPESARKNGVEGMVVIGFLVDKSGKVVDPKIMRSLDQSTNSEALKLVQNMPDWIPGHVDGRPVKTSFNLPIRFSLSDGQIPILPGNN